MVDAKTVITEMREVLRGLLELPMHSPALRFRKLQLLLDALQDARLTIGLYERIRKGIEESPLERASQAGAALAEVALVLAQSESDRSALERYIQQHYSPEEAAHALVHPLEPLTWRYQTPEARALDVEAEALMAEKASRFDIWRNPDGTLKPERPADFGEQAHAYINRLLEHQKRRVAEHERQSHMDGLLEAKKPTEA